MASSNRRSAVKSILALLGLGLTRRAPVPAQPAPRTMPEPDQWVQWVRGDSWAVGVYNFNAIPRHVRPASQRPTSSKPKATDAAGVVGEFTWDDRGAE